MFQNSYKNSSSGNDQMDDGGNLPDYVLVGNPNVGKSVVFGALTGVYVEVSNYPGTTVDISKGKTDNAVLIDTPGIYGIGDFNDEEIVARDILLKNNIVINVVNGISLERDLFLTQQLIDMGYSVIVAINQMDEVQNRGINIDFEKLKNYLGVDIYPIIAINKAGIPQLKEGIKLARQGNKVPEIEKLISDNISEDIPTKEALLALEEDASMIEKYPQTKNNKLKETIYQLRRDHINNIIEDVITETEGKNTLSIRLGHLLLNPFAGFISACFVIFLLYQLIGVFVAGEIVGITEGFATETYTPWMQGIVNSIIPAGWLNEILAGEYGLLTMTVQYIVGVLLPLVIGFFIFFAILEDSGYLPRLAVVCDKGFSKIGLNGKAIIPIILGFGCITMAVISSRILTSNRERIIATAILALTIPCSAQIAIIIALLAATTTAWAWMVYMATIIFILIIVSILLNRLLPGETSGLILDLPPMRFPIIKNVLLKAGNKTWHFLLEAAPMFALGALLLSILKLTTLLEKIQVGLSPLVVNFLGLPKETANTFIMGLIRRDFGATALAEMAGLGSAESILTPTQIVVSIIVITLFVPCIAAVMIIYKERGFLEATLLWVFSLVIAFTAGGVISMLLGIFI